MTTTYARSAVLCSAFALFSLALQPATLDASGAAGAQFGRDQVVRTSVSDQQLRQILNRIRTDAGALRTAIEDTTPRGRATGNQRAIQNRETVYLVDDVVQAVSEFEYQLDRNQVNRQDVDDLLRHAGALDRQMNSATFRPVARTAWTRLVSSFDRFASAYSVGGNWRQSTYATDTSRYGTRLSGTYRLSPADSDIPETVAQNALRSVPAADRTRISRQIRNRLTPPDTLAIERDGNRVSIASSEGPQISFDVDGQARTETGPAGRVLTTQARAWGDEIEINTAGSGGSDFSVTFEPIDDGRTLQVTRRLYNDALRQPAIVRSVYRRTSDVADWNVYSSSRWDAARPPIDSANRGVIVPTGTIVVATLDQAVNVRNAREGDRLNLTVVDGPIDLRGATIEGYITADPTRAITRTAMSVAFDQIRTRAGEAGAFDGTIESVKDPSGRNIAFDRAEASPDESRTDQAIERGAIGAAVGAVIGAVLGGGKGAAIGAVIGAGGGAGTVLIDNQGQTNLPVGTEFSIRTGTVEIR